MVVVLMVGGLLGVMVIMERAVLASTWAEVIIIIRITIIRTTVWLAVRGLSIGLVA